MRDVTPKGGSVDPEVESFLRLRIGAHEAHYGGGLVDGARLLQLFGDAATELCIRHDGDEGLFRAYQEVEFLAPVYAGDYVEVRARLVETGRTSSRMIFTAHKVIQAAYGPGAESAAEVLAEPQLVARASGVCVVPASRQRQGAG